MLHGIDPKSSYFLRSLAIFRIVFNNNSQLSLERSITLPVCLYVISHYEDLAMIGPAAYCLQATDEPSKLS